MEMTIDDADTILSCERLDSSMGCGASDEDIDEALGVAIETMRKYQQLQADYENRLKADMVAMLTELQMEIEECVDGGEGSPEFEQGVTTARVQVVEIIQEKINELKENKDGNDK
jgi:Zn ribbon nucleic-acid-binding protein